MRASQRIVNDHGIKHPGAFVPAEFMSQPYIMTGMPRAALPVYDVEKGAAGITASSAPKITIVQAPGRSRKSRCCQVTITLLLTLIVTLGAVFVAAELLSKPGHDLNSSDTKSAQTRSRIQSTRYSMPALSARLSSATASLAKEELIDYIQLATAFSAATYTVAHSPQECNFPVLATLIKPLSSNAARGYIARDDIAKLLVVAFEGISRFGNIMQGLDTKFVQMSTGMTNGSSSDMHVQNGVQQMYKQLEFEIFRAIEHETKSALNYTILVTGHNLGGSMAVLAGLMLKPAFPQHLVLVVTQGQARTFDEAATQHIDTVFPPNSYSLIRATHSTDGIVNVGSPFVNNQARHHSGEVWHFTGAAVPSNVLVCQGREDANCSASYRAASFQVIPPALPWSAESLHYFDIEMNSRRSVQCGGPGGLFVFKLLTSRKPLSRMPSSDLIARTERA